MFLRKASLILFVSNELLQPIRSYVLIWKKLFATFLVLLVLSLIVTAFIYIPKYLDQEQKARDNSKACKQYREFLQTAENWNKLGDADQANGVYNIAVDLFRKGKCTKVH